MATSQIQNLTKIFVDGHVWIGLNWTQENKRLTWKPDTWDIKWLQKLSLLQYSKLCVEWKDDACFLCGVWMHLDIYSRYYVVWLGWPGLSCEICYSNLDIFCCRNGWSLSLVGRCSVCCHMLVDWRWWECREKLPTCWFLPQETTALRVRFSACPRNACSKVKMKKLFLQYFYGDKVRAIYETMCQLCKQEGEICWLHLF